jgi:hypothetical protein
VRILLTILSTAVITAAAVALIRRPSGGQAASPSGYWPRQGDFVFLRSVGWTCDVDSTTGGAPLFFCGNDTHKGSGIWLTRSDVYVSTGGIPRRYRDGYRFALRR